MLSLKAEVSQTLVADVRFLFCTGTCTGKALSLCSPQKGRRGLCSSEPSAGQVQPFQQQRKFC